jgi:hypothetical protein
VRSTDDEIVSFPSHRSIFFFFFFLSPSFSLAVLLAFSLRRAHGAEEAHLHVYARRNGGLGLHGGGEQSGGLAASSKNVKNEKKNDDDERV